MIKTSLTAFVLLQWCVLVVSAQEHRLENEFVAFTFDSKGDLTGLTDKKTGVNTVGDSLGSIPLWEIQLVDKVGELEVSQLSDAEVQFSREEMHKRSRLTLAWNNIDVTRNDQVVSNVNVTLKMSLRDTSTISEWDLSLASNSGDVMGMWQATISLPLSIASASDGELFFPSGFGHTFSDPAVSTGGNYASTYPGGMASMQFMALGSTSARSAAYFAAMDPTGQGKGVQYSTYASSLQRSATPLLKSARNSKKEVAPVRKWRAQAKPSAAAMSFTIYPANAGVPLEIGYTWTAPYSMAVGILSDVSANEGRPLWSEAASTYRAWALDNVNWVKQGTLLERSQRADEPPTPAWYMTNTLWINTHWQCHDIFNTTGGDPAFVLSNTLEVAERLWTPRDKSAPAPPRSMALHWYEWQQGPDPDPAARYLFDTHYPDYFPSRPEFKTAVAELRKNNITTFPYINGRISDVNSISYAQDNGVAYCSKQAPAKLVNPHEPQGLQSYVETYGSNATFCVTNPFTEYWQDKLAETVQELVRDYGVPGVYIDQIGSAIPKMCWDASHHHSLGGGDFWTTGYQGMMDAISAALYNSSTASTVATTAATTADASTVAAGSAVTAVAPVSHTASTSAGSSKVGYPMVTEDNAEPYMGMVQGFLTLNAFKLSLAQSASPALPAAGRLSPAYPMIYGGYYVGFGAIWSRADFADHDWWCSKLASALVTGSQLGWFSLAGIADDAEDSCGPMGVGDLFMDSANDDLVSFLQLLSATRLSAVNYLTYGHLLRPPALSPAPAVQVFTSTFDNTQLAYDTVLVQAWQQGTSVLVLVVSATDKAYEGLVTVRLADWGCSTQDCLAELTIVDVDTKALVTAGAVDHKLSIPVKVAPRGVTMLEFKLPSK